MFCFMVGASGGGEVWLYFCPSPACVCHLLWYRLLPVCAVGVVPTSGGVSGLVGTGMASPWVGGVLVRQACLGGSSTSVGTATFLPTLSSPSVLCAFANSVCRSPSPYLPTTTLSLPMTSLPTCLPGMKKPWHVGHATCLPPFLLLLPALPYTPPLTTSLPHTLFCTPTTCMPPYTHSTTTCIYTMVCILPTRLVPSALMALFLAHARARLV